MDEKDFDIPQDHDTNEDDQSESGEENVKDKGKAKLVQRRRVSNRNTSTPAQAVDSEEDDV